MAGSPAYLELLQSLKPTRASFDLLDAAWEGIEIEPNHPLHYRMLARICYSLIAAEYALYRVEQNFGGAFEQVIGDAKELHIRKNAGYAGEDNPDPWANFRRSKAFNISPVDGVLVRMSDKKIRIENLLKNPDNEQVGEALIDTLADLAAYALIALCLWDED